MLGRERSFTVLIIVVVAIATVIILSAPIIPVQSTVTQTRTRPLRHNAQDYNQSNVPRFVNVTNTDSVGGIFSVTLYMVDYKPVVGGIEGEIRETTTQSLFINAGATEKFNSPKEWTILEPTYSFEYRVTAPTTQENCNVTATEYKSIISIIISNR
jgi:hypothetical protein